MFGNLYKKAQYLNNLFLFKLYILCCLFIISACDSSSSESNSPPLASEVIIIDLNSGDLNVGDVLSASYRYSDNDGDLENSTLTQWLRDGVIIDNATSLEYTVTNEDLPSNIQIQLIPNAASGVLQGTPVLSNSMSINRYSKINNVGTILPDDASDWQCVRDNVNSLIWEVKTDDAGLQDMNNTYRWGGVGSINTAKYAFDDWDILVNSTNNNSLCGYNIGWRVPFKDELFSLVTEPKNNYSQIPTIDLNYFPNSKSKFYWSANGNATFSAHGVAFQYGIYSVNDADGAYYVRLVRSSL